MVLIRSPSLYKHRLVNPRDIKVDKELFIHTAPYLKNKLFFNLL